MNYLAHAYLSFNHPEILTGNMISDFVKGKKKFDYPTTIQKGIMLHRAIDQFTDTHEATKEAKEVGQISNSSNIFTAGSSPTKPNSNRPL